MSLPFLSEGSSNYINVVLQVYQEDLLKDLDKGQGLSPEVVSELLCTMDLDLRVTKQTAAAIVRSMAAMVVTQRHLWLNLAHMMEKDYNFFWHIC